MDVEPKDLVTWGSILIAVGAFVAKIRNFGKRLDDVEDCLITSDKAPRFMSYKAHDRICERNKLDLNDIKQHLQQVDKKQEEILIAVIELKAQK